MGRCKMSVVVPYYNKWSRSQYLIESINRQTFDKSMYEVIFVDDGSDVPLEECLQPQTIDYNYKVIRTKNQGRSCARNIGLQCAEGNVVLFIDDDIILSPTLLEGHFREHQKQANIFVHGTIYDLIRLTMYQDIEKGYVYEWIDDRSRGKKSKDDLLSFDKVFNHWNTFSKSRRLSRLEKLILSIVGNEEKPLIQWVGCAGGNVSIDRELCIDAGGFDENFNVWGGEDFELGYRLQLRGLRAVLSADCFVYHITHAHRELKNERDISKDYFLSKYNDDHIRQLYSFLERKQNDISN